ncbi:MAG TPA: hypothetical protein VGS20_14955 [Candidatus Acidoferrales bacterium]|nr:hypothetical protein [Candidatus Acidoferrales bacterium]
MLRDAALVHYKLYGLEVESDRPLPGVTPCDRVSSPDISCHLGELPARLAPTQMRAEHPIYSSPFKDSNGLPILRIWRFSRTGHYCFQYCEGATFVIDRNGGEIWAEWSDGATLEEVTAFLLHQVFGFVLHLRNCMCVHASAVVIDGWAVLFAGNAGAGKSSTAAAFAERGHPVLADDVSTLKMEADGELMAIPSVPGICLWPDSAEMIYGGSAAERFPRLQPREEKKLVRLDSAPGKFQSEPAPLGALYLLARRSADPTAPRIEPLGDSEGLIQLLTNGYVSGALEPWWRAREFQMQGEIARRVPVQRLVPSNDPKLLGRLCDLIVSDVRAAKLPLASGR